ncbi:hypothetical protein ALI22I_13395 [Saccharothrix sp. ALI-22-I]|nr:hypothetical protein ALI22I_13395 [Saccharothrix sp. ALI-22-I]
MDVVDLAELGAAREVHEDGAVVLTLAAADALYSGSPPNPARPLAVLLRSRRVVRVDRRGGRVRDALTARTLRNAVQARRPRVALSAFDRHVTGPPGRPE